MSMLHVCMAAEQDDPVIVLSGEADLTNVAALSDALSAGTADGARHLTVDVSGLRFADSVSVRALVLAARALNDRGGSLVLVNPQPAVAKVLALTGADQAITVHRIGTGPGET